MKSPFIEDFKNNLRNFKRIEKSILKIEEEQEFIKSIVDPKSFSCDSFNNGGSDYNFFENKVINYIAKSIELDRKLKENKFLYSQISNAFEILEKNEKIVIEEFYFKNTSVKKICELLYYEEAQVYRIKNKALYKMLIFLYGKVYC